MLKYISLFSGIGAFEKALTNIGVQYELTNWCEVDKYAAKSYSLIHNAPAELNLGDITVVDESELPGVDLITYGFPCQDISLEGAQKGLFNEDGSKTRSGLFFDALRIIEHCKPKIAIAENVKNLTSKKFKEQFEIVLNSLESAGYNNYWNVLNTKHYGIPQNRERVFIVSIRKDIDEGFDFPEAVPLELTLRDLLEKQVDEKYFLSEKSIQYVCSSGTKNFYYKPEIDLDIARPLTATMHKVHRACQDNFVSESFINGGCKCDIINGSPILGKTEDGYIVRNANKQGYDIAKDGDSIDFDQPTSKTRRGRVGHGVAQTLNTSVPKRVVVGSDEVRIRKLTPKECFRLQGFDDKDVDVCIDGGLSNTQLYKQAGNSITVDVAEALFESIIDKYPNIFFNEGVDSNAPNGKEVEMKLLCKAIVDGVDVSPCGKDICCKCCIERCSKMCVDAKEDTDCEECVPAETSLEIMRSAAPDAVTRVTEIVKTIKMLEDQRKRFVNELREAMETFGVKTFENESVKFTYVAPTTKTTVDSKKLKAEYADVYNECLKTSNVSASVRITVK